MVRALAAPPPEDSGPCAITAEVLQWVAATSLAVPVLLVILGGFTEPMSHLYLPAQLQLLVQTPAALALAVSAHYLGQACHYAQLAKFSRIFAAAGFAFFGAWLLALGIDVIWVAL